MKILALEFSSPQRSVAVVQATGNARSLSVSEVVQTRERGAGALEMIAEALRQARLEREQIECLAIGLGPGSYTGVRSAIALAQGWQLASRPGGIKLLGISSIECLAAQAQAQGITGAVAIAIDAQRGEFYLADYDLDAACRREITPLRLTTLLEAQAREKAGQTIIGPEVTNWFPSGRLLFPRAAMVGELALARTDFVSGESPEPIYLRQTKFVKATAPRIPPGRGDEPGIIAH